MTINDGSLRLWALGGLGEVGMNCLVMEAERRLIIIDCGLTFPDREPGVELIHPDFETILERQDDLLAIVLTHGHEDHVGAIPYLLRDFDREIPVYGPPYALQVLRERLAEVDVPHPPRLIETKPREVLHLGPFEITPFRVTHSIPDSTGLVLKTPAGTVVHTGDFKLERDPLDGQSSDEELLRMTGDAGVRLLMSDSTNSEVAGCAGREQDVEAALRARIKKAPARVVICMFGSNIHRVGAVLRAAAASKRRVLLLGRSLRTHSRIARELGLLPDHPVSLVQEEEAQKLPRNELLVLATGSQGEPAAALRRMANGHSSRLRTRAGDEVGSCPTHHPGRERQVVLMMDASSATASACTRALRCIATRQRSRGGATSSAHARADAGRVPSPVCTAHTAPDSPRRARPEARIQDTLIVENGRGLRARRPQHAEYAGSVPIGRVHLQWRGHRRPDPQRAHALVGRRRGRSYGRLDATAGRGATTFGTQASSTTPRSKTPPRAQRRGRGGAKLKKLSASASRELDRENGDARRGACFATASAGSPGGTLTSICSSDEHARGADHATGLCAAARGLRRASGAASRKHCLKHHGPGCDVVQVATARRRPRLHRSRARPHPPRHASELRAIDQIMRAAERVRELRFQRPVDVIVQDAIAIEAYVESEIEPRSSR